MTTYISLLLQNFLALVPLALLLGEVTEDLALRFGDVIGGLLVRFRFSGDSRHLG